MLMTQSVTADCLAPRKFTPSILTTNVGYLYKHDPFPIKFGKVSTTRYYQASSKLFRLNNLKLR